jgi:diketogulonate reductase-like aldo/keto reductase
MNKKRKTLVIFFSPSDENYSIRNIKVGNTIKKSGISRDEFFITKKVWISNYDEEKNIISILHPN